MASRLLLPHCLPSRLDTLPLHPPYLPTSSHRHPVRRSTSLRARNSTFYASNPPMTQSEFLQAVSESDGDNLPCVRSYENDMARLTVIGAVDYHQAITAGAADGGESAAEHLRDGIDTMIAEAIFLGSLDDNSTISTRLFLPAKKVMEKGRSLRSNLPRDNLSSTSSKQILSMTFRQVVIQRIWSFELGIFQPGSERNMNDIGLELKVPVSFSFKSADESILSALAEVVCAFAQENTRRKFHGVSPSSELSFVSKDSSVLLHALEDEVVEDMSNLICKFQSREKCNQPVAKKRSDSWLTLSNSSKFEKVGGLQFKTWVSEYVPLYRLQVGGQSVTKIELVGWCKSEENRWETFLSHSQMVGLANILDIYFGDSFTVPSKSFFANLVADVSDLTISKKPHSFIKLLCGVLTTGIFLIAISATQGHKLSQAFTRADRIISAEPSNVSSSAMGYPRIYSMDAYESETFCSLVIQKIKCVFGWSDEVVTDPSIGSWIGPLPDYLYIETRAAISETRDINPKLVADYIASYQVTMERDGRIVGFQPMNRVAVKNWASNPLAKELHGLKHQPSPGFIEFGLKFQRPKEVIIVELLVSANTEMPFCLARPATF